MRGDRMRMPVEKDIQKIIAHLGLQPLRVEGGWYASTYQSPEYLVDPCLPARYPGPRRLGSAIYYLMIAGHGFSAIHRLLSDEIFHFYLGDPVESLLLFPDGSNRQLELGQDISRGQYLQFTVPAGTWQGHRVKPGGRFALLGTTMTPGYDEADFILAERADLIRYYPGQADVIKWLTRG